MNDFWGPCCWKTIHSFVTTYEPSMSKAFISFINSLAVLLPCEKCRNHLKDNLKAIPLEPYLENKDRLFLWSFLIHDRVNKQLGKKSPPFKTIKKIYFGGLSVHCASCEV